MSICRDCDEEITFRYVNGILTPIHKSGRCDGHKSQLKRCPKCSQMVYYVRHNGGYFWADELGDPWPKHPCFDNRESISPDVLKLRAHPFWNGELKECKICLEVVRRDKYQDHVERVHETVKVLTQPVVVPKPEKTKCDFCAAFVKPGNYARHKRKVHERVSTAKANPTIYVTNVDQPRLPEISLLESLGRRWCDLCNASVGTDLFANHMRRAHKQASPVPSTSVRMPRSSAKTPPRPGQS